MLIYLFDLFWFYWNAGYLDKIIIPNIQNDIKIIKTEPFLLKPLCIFLEHFDIVDTQFSYGSHLPCETATTNRE